jgi:phosphate transport system protein
MTNHISKQFDKELSALRTHILQMGSLVEQQIILALEALHVKNIAQLDKVVEEDDKVNEMELMIDEECQRIIARRQPAASDLRMLITISKITVDLERIGDEATKIARLGKHICEGNQFKSTHARELQKMGQLSLDMLKQSLDAFVRLDASVMYKLFEADQHLDEDFSNELRRLITFMMEDTRVISTAIDILFIAKAIERIGDHATNISEYVVFLAQGTDMRHTASGKKRSQQNE